MSVATDLATGLSACDSLDTVFASMLAAKVADPTVFYKTNSGSNAGGQILARLRILHRNFDQLPVGP